MNHAPVTAWLRARPRLTDAALAGVLWLLLAGGWLISAVTVSPHAPRDYATVAVGFAGLATIQVLPLAWRRTNPTAVYTVVSLTMLTQLLVTDTPLPSDLAYGAATYALARYSPYLWARRAGLLVSLVAGPLAAHDWYSSQPWEVSAFFLSGVAVVCWAFGDVARNRQLVLSRLEEQNAALQRDREQRDQIAAEEERTRIARDMHDVVAHHLAVIVVQADGASYAAEHAAAWSREHASQALGTIADTARTALADTRQLVGTLREEETGWAPTAAVADIPELIDRLRTTGLDVKLDLGQAPAQVDAQAGVAAYRIVQEALTNVIKHGGSGAAARVVLSRNDDHLRVVVSDDGHGASSNPSTNGHGLIGMRERASNLGGTLRAGPTPRGFTVHAELPLIDQETL